MLKIAIESSADYAVKYCGILVAYESKVRDLTAIYIASSLPSYLGSLII